MNWAGWLQAHEAALDSDFRDRLWESLWLQAEWLLKRREKALEVFTQLGFPTQRHEDYRFTNLKAISEGQVPRFDTPTTIQED